MKYRYKIFETDERGKCPYCGKVSELFYMDERREYINPVTKKMKQWFNGK